MGHPPAHNPFGARTRVNLTSLSTTTRHNGLSRYPPRLLHLPAIALTVVPLSVTTVAARVTSVESALRVLRKLSHATAVARPAISAVTVLRAAVLLVVRVAPRSATSVARSVTLRATVPMHTALEAATATAAVTAAEAAARVARLATLVAAMATCPANVSMVANATTAVDGNRRI
ncbi:hypothetical protein GGS26DRAFT_379724 [Hypomontagnella submonticulosa]|nr:hypothetical protein GGS26DRAFT_379724 [Hypomontagnella submonticulosa]